MEFKYIVSKENNPYINLAQEQSLFKYVKDEEVILFFWQNDNTIVIGKNQDVYTECKVDDFLAEGGHIARRKSGGGAVYHDMGNLCYSIICTQETSESVHYQDIVRTALKKFDINADFNGRNDLVVEERKFSGNAAYTEGAVLCQHGTILVDTDISRMTYFLTPDVGKLSRNHVSSVSSRVVNLSELSSNISIDKMINAIIDIADAKLLECRQDNSGFKDLILLYSCKEWIFGGKE